MLTRVSRVWVLQFGVWSQLLQRLIQEHTIFVNEHLFNNGYLLLFLDWGKCSSKFLWGISIFLNNDIRVNPELFVAGSTETTFGSSGFFNIIGATVVAQLIISRWRIKLRFLSRRYTVFGFRFKTLAKMFHFYFI